MSNKNIVKPAYVTTRYTAHEISELKKCILDPIYFAKNYVMIQHPVRGLIKFDLYDFQEEMINTFATYRNVIILTSRQSGKCVSGDTIVSIGKIPRGIKQLIGIIFNIKRDDVNHHIYTVFDFLYFVRKKMARWIFSVKSLSIYNLLAGRSREKCQIYSGSELKFLNKIDISGMMINTDKGMIPIKALYKTVEYKEYRVTLSNGKFLLCADNHLVNNINGRNVRVIDLNIGDFIKTDSGIASVVDIYETGAECFMYDFELYGNHKLYYTNGILSHNTTCAAAYIIWLTIFKSDQVVLIAANKLLQALEIMKRIRAAYEELPDFLRPGVIEYNKGSITFDNGSRIVSRATSPDAGRGMSVSCLSGDSVVTIRNNETGEVSDITMEELYFLLD